MKVSVWSNGNPNYSRGSGLGIREGIRDRYHFDGLDNPITIKLDEQTVEVNLTSGFWRACPEIRHPAIGMWLVKNNLHIWEKGKPHQLNLLPIDAGTFELSY